MSQGELHSLALSLFIPRATLPESPFRFIVIDDPVQSMDPARVDGLARVLQSAGKDRQVIVFTHDDRLPEAVRRLDIDATVIEVTRREGSVVEPRRSKDPVSRYIEDAMALAYTDDLPAEVARRVIPGLCREALEAACMEAVRRRRIGRGEPHAEVEALLLKAQKLTNLAALALFDDMGRAAEVMSRINKEGGRQAGDAFKACNDGAHGDFDGVARIDLVRATEKLAGWLQRAAVRPQPTPKELVAMARGLLCRKTPETAGLWLRAAALLARQALESALVRRLASPASRACLVSGADPSCSVSRSWWARARRRRRLRTCGRD